MPDHQRKALHERIRSFGADALVARLDRPDRRLAGAAGLELAQFESLDPRHLPALTRAYEGGIVWMPRAIAATGTEEALAYLRERARKSPDFSNDSQLRMALARFGDRLRPFVAAELEACGRGGPKERCRGIFATLGDIEGGYPGWAADPVAALVRAPGTVESVRWLASDFLIQRRHPVGREILRERLQALSSKPWQAAETVRQLGDYGSAAADVGALVADHLASASPDVRIEAALTLGRIEAKGEAPKLIALEPQFEDDWLLAYDALESLGRMRSAAARPMLERVSGTHWHRAVRNNAERALASLAGGDFARPGVAGDALPFKGPEQGGSLHLPSEWLRYAGDAQPRACRQLQRASERPAAQDPPEAIRWPGNGAKRLVFEPLAAASAGPLRLRLGPDRGSARIPFRVRLRSGLLTGYDQGEWGGAVVHLGSDGPSETLLRGNPRGGLRMGGRLYILEGLWHGVMSRGSVAVIAGDPPRLLRRIRLPGKPEEVLATDRRTLVIRTAEGDVAIREDGRLIDPESPAACMKGQ
jgi:HEAT repeat protein